MSYVVDTLSEGEKIGERAKLHWLNYAAAFSLTVLALLCLIYTLTDPRGAKEGYVLAAVFGIWGVYEFLKLITVEMVVTNKRVVLKTGIISVKTEELRTSKIESVEVEQNLAGRIFGYATIYFSGTGTSKVTFEKVASPWKVKSRADAIIEEE